MKKITYVSVFLICLLVTTLAQAQKVVVVGMNHTTNDGLSFVVTQPLAPGEVVYFSEDEYNNSTNVFSSGESVVTYTTGAGGLAVGQVVFLNETSANTLTVTCTQGVNCGSAVVSTTPFATGTGGDQIYAYSDTDANPTNGVTEIYSVMYTIPGNIPALEDPTVDFPNAVVVDGFASGAPNRTEYLFSPASVRDGVSQANLENPSNYLNGSANQALSLVEFTNLNLAGANPVLTVTRSPASVLENSGSGITYTFMLDANAASNITVNFSVGGSATFASDYTQSGAATFNAATGTVVINSGSNNATVTLTPVGDSNLEPDETMILTATAGVGYDVGGPSAATGTIVNDDAMSITPLVAVTGTVHTGTEGFSFVALDDITAGTVVYFTENAFSISTLSFSGAESVVSWTAPAGGVSRGEVIVAMETAANTFTTTCSSGTCGVVSIVSGNFALANDGESFFAYQDTDNDHTNGVTQVDAVLYTGVSGTPGGNISAGEDPSTVYTGAVVVDGFPAVQPNRTEYRFPPERAITVDQANFQNTANWFNAQAAATLSTVPFANIIISTGSPNPSLTLAASPTSVTEDSGTGMVFTFTLSAPAAAATTVNFTVGGTATLTTDYTVSGAATFTATNGTATIPMGGTSVAVTITPVADATVEPAETVNLMIASGVGYDGGSPNSATGTITNDDTSNSDPLVAVMGMSNAGPDGFSFVAAQNIPAGTVVYFTEDEFDNTTLMFSSGESILQWTSPAGGQIDQGDVITITETAPDVFTVACSDTSGNGCGTVAVIIGGFALATDGETISAYADNDTDPTNGVVDIFSMMFTGVAGSPGGNLPAIEDPTGIYLSALIVDGFPASAPVKTEYTPAGRAIPVNTADFENPANYDHGFPNPPALSTVPFAALTIVAETEVVLDGSGALTITDILGGNSDDAITLSTNGANLRIVNTVPDFTVSGTGVVIIDPNTVEVPLANITNGITVDAVTGNDAITIGSSITLPGATNGLNLQNFDTFSQNPGADINMGGDITYSINGPVGFRNTTTGGNLMVTTTGNMNNSGGTVINVTGTTTLNSGAANIQLGGNHNFVGLINATGNIVTFSGTPPVVWNINTITATSTIGFTNNSHGLTFNGVISGPGLVQLRGGGSEGLLQVGGTISADLLEMAAGGQNINVSLPGNDANLLRLYDTNNATFVDVDDIDFADVNVNNVTITAPTINFGGGSSVTLNSGASSFNGDVTSVVGGVLNHNGGSVDFNGTSIDLSSLQYNGAVGTTTNINGNTTAGAQLTFQDLFVNAGNYQTNAVTTTLNGFALFGATTNLIGIGTMGGNVIIDNGGGLSPGNSPGCISTGDLTLVGGSTTTFEVTGNAPCTLYDQVQVTGSVFIDPAANVNFLVGYANAPTDEIILILNDGVDAVTGTFNGYPQGAPANFGAFAGFITYTGGDGNDVSLISDNVPPTAVCMNITVQLDATGNAMIVATDVDGGSTDNVGITSYSVDIDTFSCADVGSPVTVTLTVMDAAGNSDSCTAIVTVEDNIPPSITCPADITVGNDPGVCEAVVNYTLPIATDNCGMPGGPNLLTNGSFETGDFTGWTAIDNPSPFWPWTVSASHNPWPSFAPMTATDGGFLAGNGFDGDPGMPVLYQDVAIPATGAVLSWDDQLDYDLASFCVGCLDREYQVQIRDLSNTVLAVAYSQTAVAGTLVDGTWQSHMYDLSAFAGQTIRLTFYQNIPESFTGPAQYGVDNVMINVPTVSVTQTAGLPSGSVFPVGTTTNTFEATDPSGNTVSCSFTVTVNDTEAPTAVCQNLTVQLDASGSVTIAANAIDNGSSDNCGPVTLSIDTGLPPSPSSTLFLTLGNGNDGEGIAFNPNDGFMYHSSGYISPGDEYFEPIDLSVPVVLPNIVAGNDYPDAIISDEITGLVWYPPLNGFVVMDRNLNIALIETNGTFTFLSTFVGSSGSGYLRGFALVGSSIYGVDPSSSDLVEFDPFTGAINSNIPAFMDGNELVNGAQGLTTNPVTGEVYIMYKNPVGGGTRRIGTIDVTTGIGTEIGDTGLNLAGIAFDGSGNLYGVTGNGGSPAETLFKFDGISNLVGSIELTCQNIGDNDITLVVTDASGNMASCTAVVTVEDTLPPVITCPADITVSNDPGVCEANVTVPAPTFTDNCTPGGCIQNDDIEAYALGPILGQSPKWVTWTPGTLSESGEVSTDQAQSGSQSIKIEGLASGGPVDQTYRLGELAAGVWEVTYSLYVPSGNTAYTNVQKSEVAGTEWASEVQYNSDGSAQYRVNNTYTTFAYPQGAWFEVKHYIDLTNDISEFFINGTSIISHPYVSGADGLGILATIGSIDFFAVTNGFGANSTEPNPSAIPLFYIDDISLCAIPINNYNNSADASDTYPVGSTNVIWTVTDSAGNSDSCTQVITVNDDENPVVTCPADITVSNDPGDCGAIVSFTPTVTDNCPGSTFVAVPASGSFFPIGTTLVTVTGTDASGNISTCTFNVIVNDTEDPTISCPADIVVSNDPGVCGAIVTYTAPVGMDNCPGATTVQTSGLASGSEFPVGTTTNTFVVTDASGNTATCSFNVTVNDTEDPTITCPGDIVVDNDPGVCGAVVNYTVTESDNCSTAISQIPDQTNTFSGNARGYWFTAPVDFVITGLRVPNTASNGDQNVQVMRFDVVPPNFSATGPYAELLHWSGLTPGNNFIPVNIPVSAGDIIGILGTRGTSNVNSYTSGTNMVIAGINVAIDRLGTQNPINASPAPQGTFFTEVGSLFQSRVEFEYATPITTQTAGLPSGSVFPIGTTTNTFVTTDGAGNTATCSFDVTVNDVEPPVITCPADITVNNDPGVCEANVTVPAPTFTDNCATAGCYRTDDIEAYTLGLILGQDPNWETWDPGTPSESGEVSTEQAQSGTQSVKITGVPTGGPVDQTYRLGDIASGAWNVTYSLFIPPGNTAYTNIQKSEVVGTQWGFEINYNSDGSGQFRINNTYTTFSYPQGTWFEVRHFIDTNNNVAETYINGTFVTSHPYSWSYNGTGGLTTIGAMDFFPVTNAFGGNSTEPNTSAIPLFYIDDVSLCAVPINDYNDSSDASDVYPVGTTTVTWTVTDPSGNSDSCSHTVTVVDNEPPVAVCMDITVQLDASGNASITGADVDGGSTDNCGIASLDVSPNTFTCADVGLNTVTLTVTDVNGNSSTCTATVTVEDSVPPVIACPMDISVSTDPGICGAEVFFADAVALDACGIDTVIQTQGPPSGSTFPVGDTLIEFTATDVNGNSTACTFTVTVADDDAPTAVCQDITVQLDANGQATITAGDIDGGSFDNCAIDTISASPTSFDCSDVGDNPVTLTVTDIYGNSSTCTAIVTVEDNVAPAASCMDITVELDANGQATITGADVDGGSSDACGIASLEVSPDTFDCSNVGANTVTLTVTDVNGNVSTCTATVTVEDNTDPDLVCMDITLPLDENGQASITPADVIASNDDACGILTTGVDITDFDCGDIGTPIVVTVFSQDVNGNLSSCNATVTVVDDLPPVVECPGDQTVDPGANNLFYELPDYWAEGLATAADNCTDPVTVTSQDPAAGTLLPDGTYTVTLCAQDEYGNEACCTFQLTVESTLGSAGVDISTVVLYPNPARKVVYLSNPQAVPLVRLAIYDMTGRFVTEQDLADMGTQAEIDISGLSTATYMVIIEGQQGSLTKQLVKE